MSLASPLNFNQKPIMEAAIVILVSMLILLTFPLIILHFIWKLPHN